MKNFEVGDEVVVVSSGKQYPEAPSLAKELGYSLAYSQRVGELSNGITGRVVATVDKSKRPICMIMTEAIGYHIIDSAGLREIAQAEEESEAKPAKKVLTVAQARKIGKALRKQANELEAAIAEAEEQGMKVDYDGLEVSYQHPEEGYTRLPNVTIHEVSSQMLLKAAILKKEAELAELEGKLA